MSTHTEAYVAAADLEPPVEDPRPRYSIRDWPAQERPRERLLSLGPTALATRELIAILIGAGGNRRPVMDVSTEILRRCEGSLRSLATLPAGSLETVPGIGRASACRVLAALELGRRVEAEDADRAGIVQSPEDVFLRMGPRLRHLTQEEFHALLLNSQHRLIRDVLVTRGILDATLIHPREVFKAAVVESAAGIILVHNHPSGDPSPSREDHEATRELAAAGRALGIPVLDHVVIGGDRFVSILESPHWPHSSETIP